MYTASYLRRGRGMSINAINSYIGGEKPSSIWGKELCLTKIQVEALLVYCGWHHTGKFANQTNFYRLPEDKDELIELVEEAESDNFVPKSKKKFWNKIEELKNNLS